MAMLTINKEASVKRANPVKTYPSTTSITPLIKGTPGTRYRTPVSYTHLTLPTILLV